MSCNVAAFVCGRQVAADGLAFKTAFVARGFVASAAAAAGNHGKPVEGALPMHRKDLVAHYGCVNAIEFAPSNSDDSYQSPFLLASGGDDRRVLVWKGDALLSASTTASPPLSLSASHNSNIFCLAFSDFNNSKDILFSGGNDEQVIAHDLGTAQPLDVFFHDEPVYGLSAQPMCGGHIFASASSDGLLRLFDMRQQARDEAVIIAEYQKAFHSVAFNPIEPRLVAAANQKRGVGLWDLRKPNHCVIEYGNVSGRPQTAMSVRFNSRGDRLVALRRKMPPVLFRLDSPVAQVEFDHDGYYNSCTMKSGGFAGMNDEFVVSGSDDFNIYAWKIPESRDQTSWVSKAHLVLRGHSSIVNQVRFSHRLCAIASAGVEKAIKLWSPLPLSGQSSTGRDESHHRLGRRMYSREGYIRMVLRSGSSMTHDYSTESTEENPRMNAFFDWLVQREIEGDGTSSEDDDSLQQSLSSLSSSSDGDDRGPGNEDSNQRSEFRGIRLRASGSNSLRAGVTDDSGSYRGESHSAGGANSSPASRDDRNEDEEDRSEGDADADATASRSNLRISELIARRRSHVIPRYRRHMKKTGTDFDFVRRSLLKARKMVRMESSPSSPSDEESADLAIALPEPLRCLPHAGDNAEHDDEMKRAILVALERQLPAEEEAPDSGASAIDGAGRQGLQAAPRGKPRNHKPRSDDDFEHQEEGAAQ